MVVQAEVLREPFSLLPVALQWKGCGLIIEDHRMEMHDLSPLYLLGPMGSQSPCRPSNTGSQSHLGLGRKHNLDPAWLFLLNLNEIKVSVPAD